ncbi:MAG: AAA family ATPase [Deferribacteres bacterium]|nr:AAA family ATPase [Deferribacteres bacterium]
MRIERIELTGFKSFAEKTVFKFHPGITAIVGPNGCGKSNIVDAFKWVLGEQSAKSLRGGSMEDVIFAGSATKKTKGMAEVTLILSDIIMNPSNGSDNNGSEDKKDTASISVTRRLFRSGESEYLMNKVPCRLKDIRNMFLDTGLELKAYSILEQGSIGDIVNSRPQDRRFLIEEIAGVMKYKVRKHEATNKLEASKANLQRLQDIIAEVRRQINIINRHAKKAERYREIHERIRDIEIRKAKRDLKALQADISGLASSEESLRSREAELSASVHSADALIEEKKRRCVEQERSLSEIRNTLYALEKETTEDQGRIALLRSDCTNLRERYTGLQGREGALDAEKEETLAALRALAADETETARELSGLEEILQDRKAQFSESESEITELEFELEDRRRKLFNKAEEISNAKNEINHLNLSIENINRKAEKNSRDIDSLNTNLTTVKTELRQAEDERIKIETELLEARKTREELTGILKDKKAALSGNEETLYREREQLAAMVSKLESLREMESSRMSAPDENIKILCQVADILETPPEYETAIEAVLGDKLGAAVVRDNDEIARALQHIKAGNAKRSGFITLNPAGSRISGRRVRSFDGEEGVIGRAAGFVSVRKGFDLIKWRPRSCTM